MKIQTISKTVTLIILLLILPNLAESAFDGKWIWTAESTPNQWVAFRKTFTLSSAPIEARTYIAVDSKYWLYINGSLVIFEGGLKRGPNPSDTYIDRLDISSHLRPGTNTIAVLVWYFGKSGSSHLDSGQGGLLVESRNVTDDAIVDIVSDNTWKAIPHAGFGRDSSGAQPISVLSESNIYYSAVNGVSMDNWNALGFDDSLWEQATEKGPAGGPPWNEFRPRPIPFFKYSGLMDYSNQAEFPTYGAGSVPIVAVLPSNLQVTPYLKVEALAGAVIGMETDHYTDGGNNNVRSTYLTKEGVQEFESPGWMSGTAVHYTIPENVKILELKYRESGYDTEFAGSFNSNDVFFNTLWRKAARTIYLNMRDNYMDCPTRERAQWWGDAVNEIKGGFYVFDPRSHLLTKKAIHELIDWVRPNNVLHAPIPGNLNIELPAQMLASIASFWDFYLYTGEAETVKSTYSRIKAYLNLWSLDADGLISHRDGDWAWYDWNDNSDVRILDNTLYYMALDTVIKIAQLSDNLTDLTEWNARKSSIAQNFNRVLWDTGNNAYRSPGYSGVTDDRANAMAVVSGLADTANYPSIVSVLNTYFNASPYMEFYVLEALYLMNAGSDAENRMKSRYQTQVDDPGYTLWENWQKGGIWYWTTDNHGWSSGGLHALSAYAAGIKPSQPGYETFQVIPQLGSLTYINTMVPTIKGNIAVTFDLTNPIHLNMTIHPPTGTMAKIGIPKLTISNPIIKVNGTIVFADDSPAQTIGGLEYVGKDDRYVYFNVLSGEWNVEETEPITISLFAVSFTFLSMTAATAMDIGNPPISYYFNFMGSPTGGTGGADSDWQNDLTYTNQGLQPNHQYGYRVKAKDSAYPPAETDYSPTLFIYTVSNAPGLGAFDNLTQNQIRVNWTANNNPSGTEYYCENLTTGANSDWTINTLWESTGLDVGGLYSFRVKARNSEGIETDWVNLGSLYTLIYPPGMGAFSNVTPTGLRVSWTMNGNPSGTEYYCENTSQGTNSGWVTDLLWGTGNLNPGTSYGFRVKARNGDGVETDWVDLGIQTTENLKTFFPLLFKSE